MDADLFTPQQEGRSSAFHAASCSRLESVRMGRDPELLDDMLDFYAPTAKRIVDVCCNRRKMWKGTRWGGKVTGYDINPEVMPDVVTGWHELPDPDASVDVLCYDPPHLPAAAATQASLKQYVADYGLEQTCGGDNVAALHLPFLAEAKRVLRPDGLIFAKIKDYIHNHRYQWNLEYFNTAVRAVGLTPCDLIIKRDPCGGNLKSGRWKTAHHAKNCHCYWVVVRNGRCEPRSVSSANEDVYDATDLVLDCYKTRSKKPRLYIGTSNRHRAATVLHSREATIALSEAIADLAERFDDPESDLFRDTTFADTQD